MPTGNDKSTAKSLGTKITVSIVSVILMTGLSIIVVELSILRETSFRTLKQRGIAETNHLAAASVDVILAGDQQFLQNLSSHQIYAVFYLSRFS